MFSPYEDGEAPPGIGHLIGMLLRMLPDPIGRFFLWLILGALALIVGAIAIGCMVTFALWLFAPAKRVALLFGRNGMALWKQCLALLLTTGCVAAMWRIAPFWLARMPSGAELAIWIFTGIGYAITGLIVGGSLLLLAYTLWRGFRHSLRWIVYQLTVDRKLT